MQSPGLFRSGKVWAWPALIPPGREQAMRGADHYPVVEINRQEISYCSCSGVLKNRNGIAGTRDKE